MRGRWGRSKMEEMSGEMEEVRGVGVRDGGGDGCCGER